MAVTGKKVNWTEEEDARLRGLVEKLGTKKWSYISTLFDNKGSKQCRRRWQNRLSMEAKCTSWSAEEDAILLKGHKKLGNRWTEIAKQLTGRTDNAVKNRFFALRKKKLKASSGKKSRLGVGGSKIGKTRTGTSSSLASGSGGAKMGKEASKSSGGNGGSGLARTESKIKSHISGGLSIDIPGQVEMDSPSKVFAINIPRSGLSREDMCLIDEVNLLNTPLQIAVQDAMNVGTDLKKVAPTPSSESGGPVSSSMSRFREFMNWVFAPDGTLLSARGNGSGKDKDKDKDGLSPLFASDFNFAIIPESVRSVTRHLLTKQFAHIWTPRLNGSSNGNTNGGLDTDASASASTPGAFTPLNLRRSPRLHQDFVGMKVPSPTFSDHDMDLLLSFMSPTTAAAK